MQAWGGALLGARSNQQDSFFAEYLEADDAWLVIVADGMGGHAAGALASQTAVSAFRDAFVRRRASRSGLEAALKGGLEAANQRIAEAQRGHPDRAGMGTTLLAAYLSPPGLAWISVGDSALLLFHENELRRLNADHSLRGLLATSEGRGNLLRSAVNGDEIPLVDCHAKQLPLHLGDVVLLASDGILSLSRVELMDCLHAHAASRAELLGAALIQAVEHKRDPKQDNCTIVAITGAQAAKPRSVPRGAGWGTLAVLAGIGVVLLCVALAALFW